MMIIDKRRCYSSAEADIAPFISFYTTPDCPMPADGAHFTRRVFSLPSYTTRVAPANDTTPRLFLLINSAAAEMLRRQFSAASVRILHPAVDKKAPLEKDPLEPWVSPHWNARVRRHHLLQATADNYPHHNFFNSPLLKRFTAQPPYVQYTHQRSPHKLASSSSQDPLQRPSNVSQLTSSKTLSAS